MTDHKNDFMFSTSKIISELTLRAREETDNFIFEVVAPFCREVTKMHISKATLTEALSGNSKLKAENEELKELLEEANYCYDRACEEVERLDAELDALRKSIQNSHEEG